MSQAQHHGTFHSYLSPFCISYFTTAPVIPDAIKSLELDAQEPLSGCSGKSAEQRPYLVSHGNTKQVKCSHPEHIILLSNEAFSLKVKLFSFILEEDGY